jgi:hypothetical protein
MFTITGRIYTINIISEKKIQIVLKKQIRGKQVLIAIEVFGKWKYEADKLKLKKGDKITGVVFVNANIYKGKFYNDIYFESISAYSEKSENETKQKETLFGEYGISGKVLIDEKTGKPYF